MPFPAKRRDPLPSGLVRAAVSWLLVILFAFVLQPVPARAETSPRVTSVPFATGERLSYDITWLAMRAGVATMSVEADPSADEPARVRFETVAQSSPVVTKFYPVDNRVASTVDLASFLPLRMTFHRQEGKRKNDFEYTFRHRDGLVTAVKDGKSDELQIPADAQDAISCLYYVRKSLPLSPGASLALNVHHDKKNYKLEVRVEALETLEGSWGKKETARVLVIMPFQGIFLNEGNLRVWFTTDDRRVPVRMKAKVVIGSIVAELTEGYGTPISPSP
ncbi:MAG: DUF3108 domain-containing protein [Nitrospiraceae bacterium]|nr:DUF3108 domain-containing protein [Nitrospiraceae bacterium]